VDVIRFSRFERQLCTRAGSNGPLFAAKLHLLREPDRRKRRRRFRATASILSVCASL